MRILHLNTERGWRGGEQQLLHLVKGLKEKGIEVVVGCKKGEELEKRCREAGIETIPLKGNQSSDILRVGTLGKDFDLIHAHTGKSHTLAALSKRFHKKPVIYTKRVDYPPSRNPLTSLKYNLTDLTVCVSKKVEEILLSRFPKIKTRVIYSSIDPKIETSVNHQKVKEIRERFRGKKIVGTAAALTPQKNIPNLIKAAKIVREKEEVVFLIFGEGHLKEELKKLAKKEGVSGNIFFEGYKEDIQNYIKSLDLFVLPSNNEGFSTSILTAMLLKVPVVATKVGGAEEVIENGKSGILVPPKNPVKLAHAILRLLKEENLKNQVVSRAYAEVKEKFTIGKMVDGYLKVYGEVVRW